MINLNIVKNKCICSGNYRLRERMHCELTDLTDITLGVN